MNDNVDRNILLIIYRYIHESFTRDLIVEYHSRVRLEFHDCDSFDHNICDYYIYFGKWEYNHRDLSDPEDIQRAIFDLYGKKIICNGNLLEVPINY